MDISLVPNLLPLVVSPTHLGEEPGLHPLHVLEQMVKYNNKVSFLRLYFSPAAYLGKLFLISKYTEFR